MSTRVIVEALGDGPSHGHADPLLTARTDRLYGVLTTRCRNLDHLSAVDDYFAQVAEYLGEEDVATAPKRHRQPFFALGLIAEVGGHIEKSQAK